jgi:tRNA(Ile)-lysidine synthetase-like protein
MRGARPGAFLDARVRRVVRAPAGTTVVVATSGGPDSVVLAAVLDRVARAADWPLVLAHVNHGARASAWQDECVVLSLGARLDRPVKIAALAAGADTGEAALRAGRYAALERIAHDCGAAVVATAHCAEDQTETVLLALFRGSGLDGLAGMPPRRPLSAGIDLVRPFLRFTHEQLHAELRRTGLPYALDPTNALARYRRNALRARLDDLRADFPHLDASVARCAEIVRAERAGDDRARARNELRERLRERDLLRDIPFERIEAALDAAPDARVFLKAGVEMVEGEIAERPGP